MPTEHELATDDYGRLSYDNGELRNDAKVNDPTAYRGGSRQRALVKWSGDHIRSDGGREELVLDQYKRDERHLGTLAGEVTRHLRRPGESEAGTLIETVRFDGVTYHVPIIAAAGIIGGSVSAPTPTRVTRFYSDGGKFVVNVQDDTGELRLIVYRVLDGQPESTWPYVKTVTL